MVDILQSSDEFRHEPESGVNWQENYVWHAWDADRCSGWYFHLGHIHDEGIVDVRAMVIVDGVVASATVQTSGDDCLGVPGLAADVVRPMEQIRLRYDGMGAVGPDSQGFFGAQSGETAFGFDIEMVSEHQPVNWSPHDAIIGLDPKVAGNHYEAGARWSGRLRVGDREIEAAGLLVRDHSWGARQWSKGTTGGYWAPMVFDGGRRFFSGCIALIDGEWRTFTVQADSGGIVDVSYDNWVRLNGPLVPRQFNSASLLRFLDGRMERYDYAGQINFAFARHASFKDQGAERRGLADLYSVIRSGEALGFGTLQHMTRGGLVQQGFDDPLPAVIA